MPEKTPEFDQNDAAALRQKAAGKRRAHKKLMARIRALKPGAADAVIHRAHEEVFACTDCLQCANCCKTTGPLFTEKDISRIAKHQHMRPSDFIDQYLRVDEDGDCVLQTVPCPFLGPDNYCGIYEVRPKACREYPHTDRRQMQEILGLTLKNAAVCPAVMEILQKVEEKLNHHGQ